MEQRLERMTVALERIADALEQMVFLSAPETGEADQSCQHPETARTSLGSMGAVEEWVCNPAKGGCGFQYRGAVFPVGA